mmetsp:Transcript_60205/g.168010  ORF Transcript_60205/g.168010 Transcript_60205/m.168010 type:complete len:244 (-) Transcript_60205:145-876(-)
MQVALALGVVGLGLVLIGLQLEPPQLVLKALSTVSLVGGAELAGPVLGAVLLDFHLELCVVQHQLLRFPPRFVDRLLLVVALLQQLDDAFLRLQLRLLMLSPQLRDLVLQRFPLVVGHAVHKFLNLRCEIFLFFVELLGRALHAFFGLLLLQFLFELFHEVHMFVLFFGLLPLGTRRAAVDDIGDSLEVVRSRVARRCVAITIFQVSSGVAFEQLVHHRQMAMVGCVMQRRVSVVVRQVHGGV